MQCWTSARTCRRKWPPIPPSPARPLRRRPLSIRIRTLPPRRHPHSMPRLRLTQRRLTFSLTPLTLQPPPSMRFPIRPRPILTTTVVATLTTTAGILTITARRSHGHVPLDCLFPARLEHPLRPRPRFQHGRVERRRGQYPRR